jgi:deazaflavin-dependent oxidoreductase (nitroreductase family)
MSHRISIWRLIRPAKYLHRILYAVGLGPIIGRVILLLTTTGRKSGKQRITPVQYEEIDGKLYIGSARGSRADWVRNIAADPHVEVKVKNQHFRGVATLINDPLCVADYLYTRLERHPRMVGSMMKMHHLPPNPSRAQLEELGKTLIVVMLSAEENQSNG